MLQLSISRLITAFERRQIYFAQNDKTSDDRRLFSQATDPQSAIFSVTPSTSIGKSARGRQRYTASLLFVIVLQLFATSKNHKMTSRIMRYMWSRRGLSVLTHVDNEGKAAMVDVSSKVTTHRTARAGATVDLGPDIYRLLSESMTTGRSPQTAKGNVFTVAQLAGIQAAKRTADLIPLCHTLPLSHVSVDLSLEASTHSVSITSTARTAAQTGVEMEALTAASVAALTVYDMCKAGGHGIVIRDIRLLEKTGGKKDFVIREVPNP